MRQVLIGAGTYHLVDDNLDPLPVRFGFLLVSPFFFTYDAVCLLNFLSYNSLLFFPACFHLVFASFQTCGRCNKAKTKHFSGRL